MSHETTPPRAPIFSSSTELGDQWLNMASWVDSTQAEGPGARFALWVQGCPLRCSGCCNPHMLEDREDTLVPVDEIIERIVSVEGIEGLTCIGGEPFWQAGALAKVARAVRARGLSVMVFTGQTLERIRRSDDPDWAAFLAQIDLLVDGPYVQSKHVDDRRWIGSSNQRAHFLTQRYEHLREEMGGWDRGSNTIEIRMSGGEVTINGFPHESIVELSRASIKKKS